MLTIKLCKRGDVFILDGTRIIWSPYGEDSFAMESFANQEGACLVVETVQDAINEVMKPEMISKKMSIEWLRQLHRARDQREGGQ